ncbi:MAG: DUF503 family protein [bacterium]|nr:DUF503 family protein [bacterium]
MIVGVMETSFQLPESGSLKDKRQVLRSLKDRVRRRFNVSLAETDEQDCWRRCTLSFAAVATHAGLIERDFQRILDLIEENPAVVHCDHWIEFY